MDLPRDVAHLFEGGDVGCCGDGDRQPLLTGVVLEGNVQRAVLSEGLGLVGCGEVRTILKKDCGREEQIYFNPTFMQRVSTGREMSLICIIIFLIKIGHICGISKVMKRKVEFIFKSAVTSFTPSLNN